jgi:hypothetical protein
VQLSVDVVSIETTPSRPTRKPVLQVDPRVAHAHPAELVLEAPEIPSAKSSRKVLERLEYANSLELPTPIADCTRIDFGNWALVADSTRRSNLARFAPDQRHCLLGAYLPDLAASLTDQALDMLDKILDELVRRGAAWRWRCRWPSRG